MPLPTQSSSSAGYYYGVLRNLSAASKLDLIFQLSQSIKGDISPGLPRLKDLFGAYKSTETADEIIEAIRSARVSNRDIEPL